ncbi:TPA: hypothetical protein OWU81_002676 [Staphylococcus aureus]|nr:hypothetical protein [Staphylococcus aureus]
MKMLKLAYYFFATVVLLGITIFGGIYFISFISDDVMKIFSLIANSLGGLQAEYPLAYNGIAIFVCIIVIIIGIRVIVKERY